MTKRYLGSVLAVLYLLTGCAAAAQQGGIKEISRPQVSYGDKIYVAADTAGIRLFSDLSAGKKGNVIVSPLSLSVLLAVLDNGAAGRTHREIDGIVNPEQLSGGELNEKYCNVINHLNQLGNNNGGGKKTILLDVANSLWVQDDFPIKESFLKTANSYYGVQAYNVNFADSGTVEAMNQWIEKKTRDKIKNYINSIVPQTRMYALDTVYFKGNWWNPFVASATHQEKFYLSSGETVNVDMMNAQRRINYYEDNAVQAGEFAYHGGCSMLVILPKKNTDAYVRHLDYKAIQGILAKLRNEEVRIKLPKFTFRQKNRLTDPLKSLGMVSAFSPVTADFSEIANRASGLYIDDVSQECFIDVNEAGTEAAAVTSAAIAGSALVERPKNPPAFYVDRPFVFLIRDDRTGLLLFAGKVANPLDSK